MAKLQRKSVEHAFRVRNRAGRSGCKAGSDVETVLEDGLADGDGAWNDVRTTSENHNTNHHHSNNNNNNHNHNHNNNNNNNKTTQPPNHARTHTHRHTGPHTHTHLDSTFEAHSVFFPDPLIPFS